MFGTHNSSLAGVAAGVVAAIWSSKGLRERVLSSRVFIRVKDFFFPGRRGALLRFVRRRHYSDQDAAQGEGDAENADATLRLARGRGNRPRLGLISFLGFISLEERGALGGARFHHGVQLCCQSPGLVSIIRRRVIFTRRGEAIWLDLATIFPADLLGLRDRYAYNQPERRPGTAREPPTGTEKKVD